MLKKRITYEDYDGNECTEDYYFNLSESELLRMQYGVNGGFSNRLNKIKDRNDVPQMFETFRELILLAYGEKSDDGKRFVKSKELSEAFSQTPAYDKLLTELMSSPDAVSQFMIGLIPQKLAAQVLAEVKKNPEIAKAIE